MKRSTVVGPNGSDVLDDYRTSYGTFLARHQDEVIGRIQERVSMLTRLPIINQEDTQVLRYGPGQYYHPHTDSLPDDQAGPRVATLLVYLSDPEEGGETGFPETTLKSWAHPGLQAMYGEDVSQCAKGHVAVRPRRGDGLLFWNIHPDGKTEDPLSSHEGCAVMAGAKWTTTFWIHSIAFRPQFRRSDGTWDVGPGGSDALDPGLCQDGSDTCNEWAAAGECERNPMYMVAGSGAPGSRGHCAAACGGCEACTAEDKAAGSPCYWANRKKALFLAFDPTNETRYRRPAAAPGRVKGESG
ncbi:hypothetical protein FOA52_000016 [Chlamydomonas sp. UWO 241]|nr:hypothetical protein FOA52_000016 [Chlamydomonas sp. UWO 241]